MLTLELRLSSRAKHIYAKAIGYEDKASVLAWAGAGGFTVGDWVVYHEDESTICGTHSMTPKEGPALSIMYFAKFEAKKCVFWKVHSHLP